MRNSKWRRLSRNVNEKMPNNKLNTNEKMPNNTGDSVIYYEKILAVIAEKRNQINFDSKDSRRKIAEEIAKQKGSNNMTETVKNLIDQIVIAAQQDHKHLKDYWISKAQGEKTIGESFVVHHLKVLKKLLNE